ncbi:MAG: DUF4209 domain-containing protein [Candidatus Woesearchaeota archaeon]
MLTNSTSLTKKDLSEFNINDLFREVEEETCYRFNRLINNKLNNVNDDKKEEIYLLFGAITSLKLNKDIGGEPFIRNLMFINSRKIKIAEIDDSYLTLLKEIIDKINSNELKARIADLLWIKNKNYIMAKKSIGYYLKSAEKLEDATNWINCFRRINRAIDIATCIKSGNEDLYNDVINFVEELIKRNKNGNSYNLILKCLKLLQKYQEGDYNQYALLSHEYYDIFIEENNWKMARNFSEVESEWYSLLGNEKKKNQSLVNAAETYVEESKFRAEQNNNYLVASSLLQSAIEKYRRLGGFNQRIEQIHKFLLEYEKEALTQMIETKKEFDISEQVKHIRSQFSDLELKEALYKLSSIISSPKIKHLKEFIGELQKETPLTFLLSSAILNEKGKVIAKKPSLISNDVKKAEAAMNAEMYGQAKIEQQAMVTGVILPATQQIRVENHIRIDTFFDLVKDNPFIPEGREKIFAKGLMYGIMGSYLNAVSLLVPQIENSLRYVLFQADKITSGLSDNGIQEEYNLNKLLYNYEDELNDIFGEDLIFDLRGLLVERYGSNLRNNLAHGLMNNNSFYTVPAIYAWWLTLRLCCIPHIVSRQRNLEN